MDYFIDELGTYLLSFVLSFVRTLVALTFVPLFEFKQLKARRLKAAISAGVSLPIYYQIQEQMFVAERAYDGFVSFLILKEVLIGAVIGYILAIPFWLFHSMGALIDNSRGALSAGYQNPAQGPDAAPLGDLLQKIVVLTLLFAGVLPEMFKFIYLSHYYWPALSEFPEVKVMAWQTILTAFSQLVTQFVLYAGPVILVLLLVEAAFAFLGAYSPQLQVYFMAMPAKSLAALVIVALYFEKILEFIEREASYYFDLPQIFAEMFEVAP